MAPTATATGGSAEGVGVVGEPAAAFAIGWITLTDVSTMLAVPLVLATGGLGTVLAGAGLVLLAGGAAYLPLRWLRRTDRVHALRRKSKHRGWALDLRVGLAGLFGLAALATAAGTSILIAGFTAGAVLAAVGEPRRLAQQLVGVAEGFLVPLFFVTLGARLEFGALLGSGKALLLLAGLVVAATTLHVLVAIVLRRPVAVGLLATAALGVPSAVVSIGLAQGVLDAGQAAADRQRRARDHRRVRRRRRPPVPPRRPGTSLTLAAPAHRTCTAYLPQAPLEPLVLCRVGRRPRRLGR